MKKRIVIIGGGVIGLATAYVFIKRGHEVQLLERNATLAWRRALLTAASLATATSRRWPTAACRYRE